MGSVLSLHIAREGLKVIEGHTSSDEINITKCFTVKGVEDFFSVDPSDNRKIIISNLAGLVRVFAEECQSQGVTCKNVLITSEYLGLNTVLEDDKQRETIIQFLTKDRSTEDLRVKEKKVKDIDHLVCKINWGDVAENSSVVSKCMTLTGDKFDLIHLVGEFYMAGYKVTGVTSVLAALVNLKYTDDTCFDSQSKMCIYCGDTVKVVQIKRDIPISVKTITADTVGMEFDGLINALTNDIKRLGPNVSLFIGGPMLKDPKLFSKVYPKFESLGMILVDTFGMREKVGASGPKIMTPDYLAAFALIASTTAKTTCKLSPRVNMDTMLRKSSDRVFNTAMYGMAGLAIASTLVLGWRVYDLINIEMNPTKLPSLESSLSSLQAQTRSLESTLATLTEADTSILNVMRFVTANQSEDVTVLSVDTSDMLTMTESVTKSATQGQLQDGMTREETTAGVVVKDGMTANDVEGSSNSTETAPETPSGGSDVGGSVEEIVVSQPSSAPSSNRESVIVRGYARNGSAAVSYYNSLFKSGLPVDPVLNGVEQYTLADGSEVYIFEIEIGVI